MPFAQSITAVTVRNPGGQDPDTGAPFIIGDAPALNEATDVLLLLTTENLPYLDMVEGQQFYVTYWGVGLYFRDASNGWVENQVSTSFSEPLADFRERVEAVNQGLPDPHPLPGLPIYRNPRGS